MYSKHFGLTRKPFDLIPDPRTVFMSDAHQEALAILRYGIVDRKGFLLLTGDIGTGKTTLLQALIISLDTRVHVCFIANPTLSAADFYYFLSSKYGLSDYDGNKAKFLISFAEFLKNCRQSGERVLLIIDEAHVFPVELLEEIRLLSNQEFQEYGLLSIFLVGQPELNDRLAHERLLPLRQRIGIRFHLKPFSDKETADYINFRMRKAGAQRLDIFTDDAIRLIHHVSGGTPRAINVLCDQALLSAFAESKLAVDAGIVKECVQELKIPGEVASPSVPPKGVFRSSDKSFLWQMVTALLVILLFFLMLGIFFKIYQDVSLDSLSMSAEPVNQVSLNLGTS
ncbi:MAG: AAA family ATPase [Thermodesulfobacteriota bacterium]|nr:AAA family ATPase [Thermodesulfobacteriota bacterium]